MCSDASFTHGHVTTASRPLPPGRSCSDALAPRRPGSTCDRHGGPVRTSGVLVASPVMKPKPRARAELRTEVSHSHRSGAHSPAWDKTDAPAARTRGPVSRTVVTTGPPLPAADADRQRTTRSPGGTGPQASGGAGTQSRSLQVPGTELRARQTAARTSGQFTAAASSRALRRPPEASPRPSLAPALERPRQGPRRCARRSLASLGSCEHVTSVDRGHGHADVPGAASPVSRVQQVTFWWFREAAVGPAAPDAFKEHRCRRGAGRSPGGAPHRVPRPDTADRPERRSQGSWTSRRHRCRAPPAASSPSAAGGSLEGGRGRGQLSCGGRAGGRDTPSIS